MSSWDRMYPGDCPDEDRHAIIGKPFARLSPISDARRVTLVTMTHPPLGWMLGLEEWARRQLAFASWHTEEEGRELRERFSQVQEWTARAKVERGAGRPLPPKPWGV